MALNYNRYHLLVLLVQRRMEVLGLKSNGLLHDGCVHSAGLGSCL